MAELTPKPEDVMGNVPELRKQFAIRYKDQLTSGQYDERDVKRFQSDDNYACCFLRTLKSKGDVDKALEIVHTTFHFRKEMEIWDIKDDTFPADAHQKNAIYYKGNDMQGHRILYIDVKANTASAGEIPLLKKYIAYKFEEHHRERAGELVTVILDMSGASTSNVNVDVTKFIVTCFTTYFPCFLAYAVNYEMPMLVSASWKVISAFLSKEQNKKMFQLKKKEIQKYIPPEHLWPHMK